jgi:hypothetical protein
MTPDRQIFFDPQRKRWKRLRRILDISAFLFTVVVAIFIFNVLRRQHLPELLLATPKHNYKALKERQSDLIRAEKAKERPARRKTNRKASDVPFNTGEGRARGLLPSRQSSQLLLLHRTCASDRHRVPSVAPCFRAGRKSNGASPATIARSTVPSTPAGPTTPTS